MRYSAVPRLFGLPLSSSAPSLLAKSRALWTDRGHRAGGIEADHATCLCSVLMGVACAR